MVSPNPHYNPIFCWNNEWIKSYESPWGIIEKFKYANSVRFADLQRYFGTKAIKGLKQSTSSKKYCELISLGGLDNTIVKSAFGFDLKELNQNNLKTMTKAFSSTPNEYVRERLTWCPVCIKSGYHSILHQFKLIHKCPFHNVTLDFQCKECNQDYPYSLNDSFFSEPFQCRCGAKLISEYEVNYFSMWSSFKPELTCHIVQKWLSYYEQDIKEEMIFFRETDIEKYPDALEHIVSALFPDHIPTNKLIHSVVCSSSNIKKHGNYLDQYNKILDSSALKYSRFMLKMNEAIYSSTVGTFNSITRQIKSKVLCTHRKCIKRTKSGDLSCPYAFAYVHWRKFIEDFEVSWYVENRNFVAKKPQLEKVIWTISRTDSSAIDDVLDQIERKNKGGIFNSLTTTGWIVNKVIAQLLLNHFYNWLQYATKNVEKREVLVMRNKYHDLPFFFIKIPEGEQGVLEFHIWNKPKPHTSAILSKLNCPNKNRKSFINVV
ncbi:hypothetical protein FHS18_004197 [Paenibacillus phyllosphaerae]|uniref:TniQ protein n=1 Tax=Paenibacillus phyllosphaerae TaxID=274593 RepID=A0A7W5B0Z3_9BACL|nr:TniQ family protein [Paenibacillus phyllosphaerae]MBB3112119.1 hypothetical protein [Paenibacillus phyllosphaerae]